jgi:hypothetical protein
MDCKGDGEALLIILAVVVILLILLGFFIGTPPAPDPVSHSLAIAPPPPLTRTRFEPRAHTVTLSGIGLAIMVGVKMVKRRMDVIHNKYSSSLPPQLAHRFMSLLPLFLFFLHHHHHHHHHRYKAGQWVVLDLTASP